MKASTCQKMNIVHNAMFDINSIADGNLIVVVFRASGVLGERVKGNGDGMYWTPPPPGETST